jgi:hypothetical protein
VQGIPTGSLKLEHVPLAVRREGGESLSVSIPYRPTSGSAYGQIRTRQRPPRCDRRRLLNVGMTYPPASPKAPFGLGAVLSKSCAGLPAFAVGQRCEVSLVGFDAKF